MVEIYNALGFMPPGKPEKLMDGWYLIDVKKGVI